MTVLFVMRNASGEQVGPPAALCPGPDGYGYRCTAEPLLEYIDASNDTMLYEDDDLVMLDIPFSFTFYGVDYDEVWASTNGNLQFTGDNINYANVCLVPRPAEGMDDMIAPYWDDLTLAFNGFLETEVVGQAPERIFVIEWDSVPRYGSLEDRVTFEVQLFEGSNDIIFLYEDAQTLEGANGSQATIGLQSERLGYALQAGCNQIAIHDGSVIHFAYPTETAAGEQEAVRWGPVEPATALAKGPGAQLLASLNGRGRASLADLQLAWLSQRPVLASDWRWADVDGDGEQELVVMWWGSASRPELLEIVVAEPGPGGRWQLSWQIWPLARQERLGRLALAAQGDVTGDGAEEIILRDPEGGGLAALMVLPDGYALVDLPGRCGGSLLLQDNNDDGAQEVIVGGCPGGGRWSIYWDGQAFVVKGDQ